MRLQIVSDLHVDVNGGHALEVAPETELLIVAGDVCAGVENAFRYIRGAIPAGLPVVMIPGNHEFYGRTMPDERRAAAAAAERLDMTWLDARSLEIGGVRFIGATLWTDYDFFGSDLRQRCMDAARVALNDHRAIGCGDPEGGAFTPEQARDLHLTSRAFIETALARPFAGPTVVITHHVPHERSVAARYRHTLLTAAFASDLSAVIARFQPKVWVHGHTHTSFNYRLDGTQVICNPLGYGGENPAFDPALTIAV